VTARPNEFRRLRRCGWIISETLMPLVLRNRLSLATKK
jgi:hypothetical protein